MADCAAQAAQRTESWTETPAAVPGVPHPDLELMARAAAGERVARRELGRRVVARVERVVRRWVGHDAEHDDVIQTCLVEIIKAASSFRGDAPVEAWAERIAIRHACRCAQRQRRHTRFVDPVADPTRLPARGADTDLEDALPRPLPHYLARLPEPQRTAVTLRYSDGHSVDEIADLTEAESNTVKVRLRRALKRLRQLILADDGEPRGAD